MPTFERKGMIKRRQAFPNEILKSVKDIRIDPDNGKPISYEIYCKYKWDSVFSRNEIETVNVQFRPDDIAAIEARKLLIQGFVYKSLMKYKGLLETAIKEKDYLSVCLSLEGIGNIYFERGDIEISTKFHEKTLEIYETLNFGYGQIDTIINICKIKLFIGELAEAERLLEKVETLSKQLKYIKGSIGIGQIRVNLFASKGGLNEALSYGNSTLGLLNEYGEEIEIADQYCIIGNIRGMMSNLVEAESCFNKALSIYEKNGFKKGIGIANAGLGAVQIGYGNFEKALARMNKAVEIIEDIENVFDKANTLIAIGDIHREKQDGSGAIMYYGQAEKIYKDFECKSGQARLSSSLGLFFLATGDLEQAEKYLTDAYEFYTSSGLRYYKAFTGADLGMVFYLKKEYSKALNYLKKSVAQFNKMKIRPNMDMLLRAINVCESKSSAK